MVFEPNPATRAARMNKAAQLASRKIKIKHGLKSMYALYYPGVGIYLNDIQVARGERKRGKGSAAMDDLTKFADRRKTNVVLHPGTRNRETGTTSSGRLRKFYGRFGFVSNKGRNKDWTLPSGSMYRKPRGMKESRFWNRGSHRMLVYVVPDFSTYAEVLDEAHDRRGRVLALLRTARGKARTAAALSKGGKPDVGHRVLTKAYRAARIAGEHAKEGSSRTVKGEMGARALASVQKNYKSRMEHGKKHSKDK